MGTEALERVKRRVEARASAEKKQGGAWEWLKGAALVLASLSAVGTLVGYGTARAYDSVFGISYALWFDSPMDLLAMSGDAVVGLLVTLPAQLGQSTFWSGIARLGLIVGGIVLALSMAHWAGTSTSLLAFRGGVALKLRRAGAWLTTSEPHFRRALPRLLAIASMSGVIGTLCALSGGAILMGTVFAVALLPVLGHIGASSYARATIIEPSSCISPIALRLQGKSVGIGAPCVEVLDPGTGKVHAGRLILARGSRVFLYSKEEDRAFAFTIKDSSISTGRKPTFLSFPAEH